ncbi:hypothetical protein [Raoultibacter phocaeensis]|uniref:hypothetical protein n=1 Tax=Raoultibacter phocaeensis TaxID=2479841 RepID=UPI00111A7F44|nr:hypothetical protein [Raoultibacter phocaeensis]
MINEDVLETELAFNRLKKISKGIRLLLIVLACFVIVLLAIKLGAALFATPTESQNVAAVLFTVVSDLIVMACLFIGASVFSALGKGEDPFSKRQSRIIRIAALLMLLDVIIGIFASVGFPLVTDFGQASVGLLPSQGGRTIVSINAGELVIAGILVGLSVIFDYARLLQKLSDETL